MSRLALGLSSIVLATAMSAWPGAQAQTAWPEESWNPRPLPEDLVLPLPCGGSIAFRPVATPLTPGALSDRETTLGWSNSETNYSEFLRHTFIAGSFKGPTPQAPPRYYMAKYEITTDQYAAVIVSECANLPTPAGRMPKTNVAWHEAIVFTTTLSSWLIKNAKAKLPSEGDALGFTRLPTEDEWEYAARGGADVSDVEFAGQTFPMPNGIERYVWFQGTKSAGGRAQLIGRLEPNPLGLFDILGNVREWTIEPYRLNKVGRPHGLAGGVIVRGGDYLTPERAIRSAMRVEVPSYNSSTGEPYRSTRTGFRPVLARASHTGDQQLTDIQKAFEKEAQGHASAADDPLKLLETLRNQVPDSVTKTGITKIEASLQTFNRTLRDKESQELRGLIQTATHLARQIIVEKAVQIVLGLISDLNKQAIESNNDLVESQDKLAAGVRDLEVRNKILQQANLTKAISKFYGSVDKGLGDHAKALPEKIAGLKTEYVRMLQFIANKKINATQVGAEGQVVLQEFQAQRPRGWVMAEYSKVAVMHIQAAANGKMPSAEQIEKDLTTVGMIMQAPPGQAPR